jgi:hypothetical protein
MSARRLAACGALTLVVGCYRYAPLVDGGSPDGSEVRLSFGPNVGPELSRILGEQTVGVDGRIASSSDSALTVEVSGTRKADDPRTIAWTGESVLIPRAAIADIQRRTLDKKRTFGIAGLAVLGAAGITLIVDGSGSKSSGDGDGGGVITPP